MADELDFTTGDASFRFQSSGSDHIFVAQ
uniref:Eukaryotic translation initiation factor 5A2 transcript variant 4 n=1 Tax=Gallus gallus TaxID=9031 RepID=A0A1B1XXT2_CHICK|nr:eukaryotic translation initiation factor 5A2 transcript variant 4 [Gallus gallus]